MSQATELRKASPAWPVTAHPPHPCSPNAPCRTPSSCCCALDYRVPRQKSRSTHLSPCAWGPGTLTPPPSLSDGHSVRGQAQPTACCGPKPGGKKTCLCVGVGVQWPPGWAEYTQVFGVGAMSPASIQATTRHSHVTAESLPDTPWGLCTSRPSSRASPTPSSHEWHPPCKLTGPLPPHIVPWFSVWPDSAVPEHSHAPQPPHWGRLACQHGIQSDLRPP